MIRETEVIYIGKITRPHGLAGEVVLAFTDDVFDRVECEYLVCKMDGILVPFFMEEYRFKSDTTALIKFERIDNAEQARTLQGVEVYFPLHLAEQANVDELSWNWFVGVEVEDVHAGRLGKIVHVDDHTVNTLFVVEAPQGELLIPAQEEFIVEINREQRILTVDLPEGLLEL